MDIGTGVFGRITENRLSRYDYVLSGQAEIALPIAALSCRLRAMSCMSSRSAIPAAEEATFGPVLGRMAESFGLASEESGETLPAPRRDRGFTARSVLQILTDELRALLERLP